MAIRALPMRATAGASLVEMLLVIGLGGLLTSAAVSIIGPTNELARVATETAGRQDGARSTIHLLAASMRRVPAGGVLLASPDSVVVAMPMGMGVFCANDGNRLTAYLGLGGRPLEFAAVDGYAIRDAAGTWSFTNYPGTSLFSHASSGQPDCVTAGGGRAGQASDYFSFRVSTSGLVGSGVLVWDRQTFRFGPSLLDPTTRGFHYGSSGRPYVELAYGLHPQSRFQYRLRGSTTWLSSVNSASLPNIDVVRVMVAGDSETSAADMTRDIPLMNTEW